MFGFEDESTGLMARALHDALDRLRTLGLVDGDMGSASKILAQLIVDAFERGERDKENLILYAMGRFQAAKPVEGDQPGQGS
jgi:hypothetical protein